MKDWRTTLLWSFLGVTVVGAAVDLGFFPGRREALKAQLRSIVEPQPAADERGAFTDQEGNADGRPRPRDPASGLTPAIRGAELTFTEGGKSKRSDSPEVRELQALLKERKEATPFPDAMRALTEKAAAAAAWNGDLGEPAAPRARAGRGSSSSRMESKLNAFSSSGRGGSSQATMGGRPASGEKPAAEESPSYAAPVRGAAPKAAAAPHPSRTFYRGFTGSQLAALARERAAGAPLGKACKDTGLTDACAKAEQDCNKVVDCARWVADQLGSALRAGGAGASSSGTRESERSSSRWTHTESSSYRSQSSMSSASSSSSVQVSTPVVLSTGSVAPSTGTVYSAPPDPCLGGELDKSSYDAGCYHNLSNYRGVYCGGVSPDSSCALGWKGFFNECRRDTTCGTGPGDWRCTTHVRCCQAPAQGDGTRTIGDPVQTRTE